MISKPRIIFAGTSSFAVPALQALAREYEVILVITQPRKPAGRGLKETACAIDRAAQELGLTISHPLSLKQSLFQEELSQYPCDFLVVASYGKIIPSWLLQWPRVIALNIHGSLLPRWRGASPIQHALLHGDSVTGVGIMQMTAGLDEGPVFLEKTYDIAPDDTQETLTKQLSLLGASALLETLKDFDKRIATPQQGPMSYAPKILKEHGQVNWEQSAQQIINQFRAFTPWPGIFSFDQNKQRVKICQLALVPAPILHGKEPGQVELIDNQLIIHTGSGAVIAHELQWEGKKALSVQEALKTQHPLLKSLKFFK